MAKGMFTEESAKEETSRMLLLTLKTAWNFKDQIPDFRKEPVESDVKIILAELATRLGVEP